MGPYATRKRTSSTPGSQGTQLKEKASASKVISKTKNVVSETSELKSSNKAINTRSTTKAKKVKSRKDDVSSSQDTSKKQESTKSKKLPKERINDKLNPEKIVTRSRTNINKQESKDKKKKVIKRISKNVSTSKQMSLKESFLNQSKRKLLHSHQNSKNFKNDTSIKKLNVSKKKLPIYKCVSPEYSKENTSEIYEFKFDIDDSKERLPKKRKKKTTVKKILVNKRKRNILLKQNLQKSKINVKKQTTGESEDIKRTDPVESQNKNPVEPLNENKNFDESLNENKNSVQPLNENKNSVQPLNENKNSMEPLVVNKSSILNENLVENPKTDVETNKQLKDSANTMKEQTVNNTVAKPAIISIEDISDKRISVMDTSQLSNSDNFKPFRPTNIFNNRLTVRQKNMFNHSLLEKSLSPITKSTESQQINSPWRASPLLTFSQVKNVFQSTPQNKYDIIHKKLMRPLNNEFKQFGSITKPKSNLQQNDENTSVERRVLTNTPKKKSSLISRKFGTEITNIDHSLQSKSSIEQINEQVPIENENIQPNVQSVSAITPNVNNALKLDNKKNKKDNILSPKKSFKMVVKAQVHQEDMSNVQSDEQKENFDPQAGPSGLQIRAVLNEQRVLRQSNLNNFLNIMEMPHGTTIKTHHGIFDDTQSTPISSRSVKKLNESNVELKNAFGFNDDDSDQEMSSVNSAIKSDKQEKTIQTNLKFNNIRPVTRLSIDEIKNKLLVKKPIKIADNKENTINEKKEAKKSPIKKINKQPIDIVSFSDTFDVLSETGETSAVSVSDIPLFADFEPSHFTQPPRHSYKRKRAVKYSFSEDETEEEQEKIFEHEVKRKKIDKLKKEQEKRLKKWVENINKTFTEIDQYDLLIE